MSRTRPPPFQQVVFILIVAFAMRALLGDEIGAFIDGMILGFTDGV